MSATDDDILRRVFQTVRASDAHHAPPFEPMMQFAERAARLTKPEPRRSWIAYAVGFLSAAAVVLLVLAGPLFMLRTKDSVPPTNSASGATAVSTPTPTLEPLGFLLDAPGVHLAQDHYSSLDGETSSERKGNSP